MPHMMPWNHLYSVVQNQSLWDIQLDWQSMLHALSLLCMYNRSQSRYIQVVTNSKAILGASICTGMYLVESPTHALIQSSRRPSEENKENEYIGVTRQDNNALHSTSDCMQPNKPTLLNPVAFGFKKTDELLLPVKGVKPIPEEYTILCNCKKCSNGRCACRKAGLPCISFCKCQSLQDVEETVQCQNPSGSIKGWYIGLTHCVWLLRCNMNPRRLNEGTLWQLDTKLQN